jgi:hypothetical protein
VRRVGSCACCFPRHQPVLLSVSSLLTVVTYLKALFNELTSEFQASVLQLIGGIVELDPRQRPTFLASLINMLMHGAPTGNATWADRVQELRRLLGLMDDSQILVALIGFPEYEASAAGEEDAPGEDAFMPGEVAAEEDGPVKKLSFSSSKESKVSSLTMSQEEPVEDEKDLKFEENPSKQKVKPPNMPVRVVSANSSLQGTHHGPPMEPPKAMSAAGEEPSAVAYPPTVFQAGADRTPTVSQADDADRTPTVSQAADADRTPTLSQADDADHTAAVATDGCCTVL